MRVDYGFSARPAPPRPAPQGMAAALLNCFSKYWIQYIDYLEVHARSQRQFGRSLAAAARRLSSPRLA